MKILLQKLRKRLILEQKILIHKTNKILKKPKKLITLLVGILSMALIGFFLSSNLVVSLGHSIDKKVFWKTTPDNIQTGDYVVVTTDKNDQFAKGKNISKIVGCSGGEILLIKNDEYYCQDNYLGKAKKFSKTGIPVKPYNPCNNDSICMYRIPDNYYFVIGTHKDSYDSRYFGVIPKERIIARLIPIW